MTALAEIPDSRYSLQIGGESGNSTLRAVGTLGGLNSSSGTYASAREGTGSLYAIVNNVGQDLDAGVYWVGQEFLAFDTAQIPAGSTILSAVLSLYVTGDFSTTDFTLEARGYDWGGGAIAASHWRAGSVLASYPLLASESTAGMSDNLRISLASAAALSEYIKPGTATRMVLCSSRQRVGTTPTGPEYLRIITMPGMPDLMPLLTVDYRTALGEELTLEIEAESLVYSSGLRGFASLEADVVLADCNEVVSNLLAVGRSARLFDNGEKCWEGEIVDLPFAAPEDPVQRIACAGRWERARRHEGYCKWFVSSNPYERFAELPAQLYGDAATISTRNDQATTDTDGQLLLLLPQSSAFAAAQGVGLGLWLHEGMDRATRISRVAFDYVCEPGTAHRIHMYTAGDLWGGAAGPVRNLLNKVSSAQHGRIDVDVTADNARALLLWFYTASASTTGADRYVQIRNLEIYCGTQAKRRVDEAIVEILHTDTQIAASVSSEAIGAPLADLVIDPHTTAAGAIEQIEARHSLPVLSGIWDDGQLVVKQRPTAPPERTRHYVVSARQDPIAWNVQRDDETTVEYAKVLYDAEPENAVAQPSPVSATWPSEWGRSDATNVISAEYSSLWWLRLRSNSSHLNPWASYRPPDGGAVAGVPVTPGVVYFARCRLYSVSYSVGTMRFFISWRSAVGTQISASILWSSASAVASERWVEGSALAPAGAVYAQVRLDFTGASGSPVQDLRARDVEFRRYDVAGTRLSEYVPEEPATQTSRVAVVEAGHCTRAEARAVGVQYLAHYQRQASGGVDVPDYIRDIDGRIWPLSHIRAWDWIECPDYLDPAARGPFMLTHVEVQQDLARLAIGGVDTYAYDPPERARVGRRRYIGAAYVWRRVKVKVKGKWRWVWRKFSRKGRYAGERVKYERVAGVADRAKKP